MMKTLLLIILFSVAPVAFAKGGLAEQHEACAAIKADKKRLACFDKIQIVKKSAEVQREKQNFGIKKKPKDAIESISETVSKVVRNPFGDLTITLASGQVWKQTNGPKLKLKVGDKIIVKSGSFGSFKLRKVDENKWIKVKRHK